MGMKYKNKSAFCTRAVVALMFVVCFWGCSEEKKEPLPDLPAVELPKEVPGFYSGAMPCEDCKAVRVMMTLKEDLSVEVSRAVVTDSIVKDSLVGTYTVADDIVKISLAGDSLHWNYRRDKSGNLNYLTGAGTEYVDKNGMMMGLIRIMKPAPKTQEN